MSIRRILPPLLTLLVVAFVGFWAWVGLKSPPVSEPAAIITTPARWQRIDAGQFSLYAPAGTRLRKVRGADSVYGDIIGPNTCLRFNVGTGVGILADKYKFRDELQKIEALVKGAVGFNQSRGDQVTVANIPFQEVAA